MNIYLTELLKIVVTAEDLMLVQSANRWFVWDDAMEWSPDPKGTKAKAAIAKATKHLTNEVREAEALRRMESSASPKVLMLSGKTRQDQKIELRKLRRSADLRSIEESLLHFDHRSFLAERDKAWLDQFVMEQERLNKCFRWLIANATHHPQRVVIKGSGVCRREALEPERWPDKYRFGVCATDLVRHGLFETTGLAQAAMSFMSLRWGGDGSPSPDAYDWPLTAILPESAGQPTRYLIKPVPLSPVQRLMLETIEQQECV